MIKVMMADQYSYQFEALGLRVSITGWASPGSTTKARLVFSSTSSQN
jgi:hypothetical protein